jgi:transposase
MARKIQLTEAERETVLSEIYAHPAEHVRRKMLVLRGVDEGLTREAAGRVAGVSRATAQRYLGAYLQGGLDGLRRWNVARPVSALADHAETIKNSLTQSPVRTTAEAAARIKELTGIGRGLTQTRAFLKGLGLSWQRVRAVPVPPKSRWPNTPPPNANS